MSAVAWPWALAHIRVFFHLWEVGILAGGVHCVILTLCAHQAPDWVDAEECHRCRVQFGVVTRKVSVPAPGGGLPPEQPCGRAWLLARPGQTPGHPPSS